MSAWDLAGLAPSGLSAPTVWVRLPPGPCPNRVRLPAGPPSRLARVTSVDVELGLTALAAMLSPTTLTFTVFALVLGDRPLRTGLWFFIGAFGATLVVGVVAAFVLGNSAAPSGSSETPPTAVAIIDVVFGVLVLVYVVRALRRPPDPARRQGMVDKMGKLASSPV